MPTIRLTHVLPHWRMLPRHRALPHRLCSRCLTDLLAEPQLPFSIPIQNASLMLALWSCGRRGSVVQAQRQIHRALWAVFKLAEVGIRTLAQRAALEVVRGIGRIGSDGSEYHLVRGFSAPLLQTTLQCPQLPVRVGAGSLSLQPLQ